MIADSTSPAMDDDRPAVAALKEALRASEARFRSVVEGSPQGIIIQQDDRIVYANPAMAKLFGYACPGQMIGLDPFTALIDGDHQDFRRRTAAAYRGEALQPHPGWLALTSDGSERWMSSTAHTSEWLGRPAVTSFYTEITERKRAEIALHENERLYRSALQAGRLGAWETDLEHRTRKWTPEGMRLFGISLRDGIGTVGGENDEYAAAIHPEDRHLMRAIYQNAATMDSFPAEYRIVRPGGEVMWLSGRGQVVERSTDGRARRLISIMADVTERRSAEVEVELLTKEIAHRSKNLLSIIQAVTRQTIKRAQCLQDFQNRFELRLQGLASSHDVLTRRGWRGAQIRELVTQHLSPFVDVSGPRVSFVGDDVTVDVQAAQALGLAIHELATNAVKYGSLSGVEGRVDVDWRYDRTDKSDIRALVFTWTETGGPPPVADPHKGFGSIVLGQMISASLGGTETRTLHASSGLVWSVHIPAKNIC